MKPFILQVLCLVLQECYVKWKKKKIKKKAKQISTHFQPPVRMAVDVNFCITEENASYVNSPDTMLGIVWSVASTLQLLRCFVVPRYGLSPSVFYFIIIFFNQFLRFSWFYDHRTQSNFAFLHKWVLRAIICHTCLNGQIHTLIGQYHCLSKHSCKNCRF